MTPSTNGQFTEQESIEITEVHGNLSQQVIKITVDKLSLILHRHASSIEQRKSWVAPLGIFLTILVVLITTTFNKVIWSAETWTAIFVISCMLSFIWLIRAIINTVKSESIDDLIEKIKKQD